MKIITNSTITNSKSNINPKASPDSKPHPKYNLQPQPNARHYPKHNCNTL